MKILLIVLFAVCGLNAQSYSKWYKCGTNTSGAKLTNFTTKYYAGSGKYVTAKVYSYYGRYYHVEYKHNPTKCTNRHEYNETNWKSRDCLLWRRVYVDKSKL